MTVSNKMAYAALAQSTWTETSLGHKRRGRRLSLEQPSPGAHTGSEGAAGWAQPEGQTDPSPPPFTSIRTGRVSVAEVDRPRAEQSTSDSSV